MVVCLAAVVAGGAVADVVTEFSNPSGVNLLECWNPDGSYGVGVSISRIYLDAGGAPTGVIETKTDIYERDVFGTNGFYSVLLWSYNSCGSGFAHSQTLGEDWIIEITFDFGRQVTIGELVCGWRAPDHAANNYAWVDDQGNVVASTYNPARLGGMYTDTPNAATTGTVTTSTLTYRVLIDGMSGSDPGQYYHNAGLSALAVYLADGQSLSMADGNYNIFYQETDPATGNFSATWTDHVLGAAGSKPSFPDGSCTWEFSQAYELHGMVFSQYDYYDQFSNGRYLGNAKLEVSMTGEEGEWTTVFEREKLYWFRDGEVYIPFDIVTVGQFVRLSWDNTENLTGSGDQNQVEINEIQLFGRPIPEPATMILLAAGGVALLRRRR